MHLSIVNLKQKSVPTPRYISGATANQKHKKQSNNRKHKKQSTNTISIRPKKGYSEAKQTTSPQMPQLG
jgi:hypothetical protein